MNNDEKKLMGEILSTASAYWQSCAIHAAVRLDVFTIIGDEERTASDITQILGGSLRGIYALLNALAAMKILLKKDDSFRNAPGVRSLLSKNSPHYIGHIIKHHHHLVDGWAQLHKAVISGKPVEMRSYGEEEERESFLLGMHNMAMGNAPTLAKLARLEERHHLLDLGGGPGTYSIFFCKEAPGLKATILDRPTTKTIAEKNIAAHGLSDRISFQGGDFVTDPIQGNFDAVWISQILHSFGPSECRKIIRKCANTLKPGGIIMVHEFFLNVTKDGPLFPALFSLNMLINNNEGQSYSEKELASMMEEAGLHNIYRLPEFQGSNNSHVIVGEL